MVCESWEGLTIDGKFPLLEWLRGSTRCVFLTVRQGAQESNIKLIAASGTDADQYLAHWETSKALSHPSLARVFDTGTTSIDSSDLVYVVTEKKEMFLSELIPRKALNGDTAKAIIMPVVDALSFLHEKGIVHGNVKPANIVQIGQQWKLAADEIASSTADEKPTREPDTYDAPEFATEKLTAAADLWSLGIITIEAFAQKTPMWDRTAHADLGVPDFIPEPFREIAQGCLRWEPSRRISTAQIKALLDQAMPASPEPKTKTPSDLPAQTSSPPHENVTAVPEPPAKVAPVVDDSFQAKSPPRYDTWVEEESAEFTPRSRLFGNLEEESEPRSMGWLIFFGIVALVVIAAVLAVRGYWSEFWRPAQTENTPQASQPPPPSQTPPAASTNDQGAPATASPVPAPNSAQPAPEANQTGAPPATASQGQQQAQSSPPVARPVPESQPPAASSTHEPPAPSAAQNEPAEPAKKAEPKAEHQAPRILNAKGAVEKRVLPAVSPGASQAMRRPVDVEIRVSVNERGTVENAHYVTQGAGNYFARIARQAAESWKFKPPVTNGHSRSSQWILLFRFERKNVNVTATEVH
jgi:serine/threonine protein kinase